MRLDLLQPTRHSLYAAAGLSLALALGCQSGPSGADSSQPEEAQPMQKDIPESKGLELLEPIASYGGHIEEGFDSQIIRDPQNYDALVAKLPKNKVIKGPPQPSEDPLLDQPAIDFDRRVLAVVTCPTYYCKIDLLGVRRDGEVHTLVASLPGEGEEARYAARPYWIGNYRAVVLPAIDGAGRWELRVSEE